MNTYNLPARPLYTLPALALHECTPGHSFQAALALEGPERPGFRKEQYFSGYGEGWGLYTEWLGGHIGIYETPYEEFGQLTYEIWRATRLIGLTWIAGRANGSASKAGLVGMARSMARELGSRGITCSVVAPGFVETDMTAELGEEAHQRLVAHIPLARVGEPREIAGAVLFLAGERAAPRGQWLRRPGGELLELLQPVRRRLRRRGYGLRRLGSRRSYGCRRRRACCWNGRSGRERWPAC